VLDCTDLTVRYGPRVAVSRLDLAVPGGHWCCLIGPNGAGKSTVLKAIAHLVAHDGVVTIDGRATASLGARALARLVAHVPQQPVLPDEMAVDEYVLLGRTPYIATFGIESADDRAIVAAVLADLDLVAFAGRTLGTLSGGERQRVVLARALAQQAPILLLDEPTSALDLGHAQQVLELVDRLRRTRGLTVVMAMHDLTLAGQYADQLVLLRNGAMTAAGRPDEVITEEALRRHYGADVRIVRDECGGVAVVPVRPHRA
jgi:iron complex transport system ATP-binding protein